MSSGPLRDLGEQPLARLMAERGLRSHDLVAGSTEQLTHKMVARAARGRRLTPNTMGKVVRAFSAAVGEPFAAHQLFDYAPRPATEAPLPDPGPAAEELPAPEES